MSGGGPCYEAQTTTPAAAAIWLGALHVDEFLFFVAEDLDFTFDLAQNAAVGSFLFQGSRSCVEFEEAWM